MFFRCCIVSFCGSTPIFDQTMTIQNVVLSHGHIDHFGGIFSHARAYSLVCGGGSSSIPNYYIPEELIPNIQKACNLFSDIDATTTTTTTTTATTSSSTTASSSTSSSSTTVSTTTKYEQRELLKMNIIPMKVGKEVEINIQTKKEKGFNNNKVKFYLRPFEVSHCCHPSLGYNIISKTTITKLKEEYQGIGQKELAELVRSGIEINIRQVIEKVEVCYTGDTSVDGLLLSGSGISSSSCCDDNTKLVAESRQQLKEGFQSPLIICELTYLLEKERELAKDRGHMNLYDIESLFESHHYWETDIDRKIIFYHLSSRAKTAKNILETLSNTLPKKMLDITEVALASFQSKSLLSIYQDNGCISISDYLRFCQESGSSKTK